MGIDWLFRERCPICKRRGLESHYAREDSVGLRMRGPYHYPPKPRYRECVYCGARFFLDYDLKKGGPFRRPGRSTRRLHAVSDKEWDEKVMPKDGE